MIPMSFILFQFIANSFTIHKTKINIIHILNVCLIFQMARQHIQISMARFDIIFNYVLFFKYNVPYSIG